jgi:SulP family sulfate permease
MKRMSEETSVERWKYVEELEGADKVDDLKELAEQEHLRHIPMSIAVYEITGPLFFGAADQLKEIGVGSHTRCLILRMRGVPALDVTALNALKDLRVRLKKQGITLVLSHVNEQPMNVMEKGGFIERVGAENVCENIDAAIARAEQIVSKPKVKK